MKAKEKKERKENFIEWVTFIPDRIIEFKKNLPKEISDSLDGSPESLEILENYMIQSFSIEDIQNPQSRDAIDGFMTYTSDVFQKKLPNAKWSINLEDESNIYFALPVISNGIIVPLSLFGFLERIFYKKSGTILKDLFILHLNYCNSKK
jgi:hypothetical protein